jgi:hypothetical protein
VGSDIQKPFQAQKSPKGPGLVRSFHCRRDEDKDERSMTHTELMTAAADSADLSKTSLADCYSCCTLLVNELLKRCTHKDMSAEYRAVAIQLQDEVLASLLCPSWPVCVILHEQLIRKTTRYGQGYG